MEKNIILNKKENLKIRTQWDITVVFDSENEYLYEMNEIATEIFNQIDGIKNVWEIISFFTEKYKWDEETIVRDINYQLKKFKDFSIVK